MEDDTISPYYIPQNELAYTPFFKRNVFTGPSQFDQTANLITSPEFQRYWSKGGNQTDNTSLLQIDSPAERLRIQRREGSVAPSESNFNIDKQPPRLRTPSKPIPPEGIRNIQFAENGWPMRVDNSVMGMDYSDVLANGEFVPVEQRDIFPELTKEEKLWWNKSLNKYQQDLNKVQQAQTRFSSIPIELRNQSGALVRSDRDKLRLLNYGITDQPLTRMVNASSPRNLLNLSAEFQRGSNSLYGGPSIDKPNILRYLSTQNPDVALSVLEGSRLQQIRDDMRLFDNAQKTPTRLKPLSGDSLPYNDIVTPVPEPVAVPDSIASKARRVGKITKDFVTGGELPNPWVDPLPSSTITVMGPPERFAGVKTALKNAPTVLGTGLTVGLTPFDAINRRDMYFTDFYNRERRDPSFVEDIGLRLRAGIEPALSMATFGSYDVLAETPTYKAYLDQEARDLGRRRVIQAGIDYPMVGGYQVQRTTR